MQKFLLKRLRRLARHRKRGQSIPIIALMILILVAMVALSVDVGNTFSEERKAVSASNAASIAAMSAYIDRSSTTTDQSIYNAIVNSLQSNGITPGDGTNGTVKVAAYYLSPQGEVLVSHPVVGSGSEVPTGVGYIQVKLEAKVNTSFARVVGQNDLPITASAHAGACPVNSSVYPLAIDSSTLGTNKFNSNGTTGTSPEYVVLSDGSVQRRIYVKENNVPGSFSWLRWMEDKGVNGKSATSAEELTASMTGEGNISKGFEEAPWPAGESAPEGYPLQPNALNIGDWVWGTSGWMNSASLDAALDNHIYRKTFLILPIYNSADVRGTGSNVQFRISDLGTFMITGRGHNSKGWYFDMIYRGAPTMQYNACSVTPPPPEDATLLELFGGVSFFPEYQTNPVEQRPIQYVVVLDTSGSMSANFDGRCNNTTSGSNYLQCSNGPAGSRNLEVSNTGVDYWWNPQNERRIYVAKKALERLVSLTNMPGNTGYTTTRPADKMAVVWFNSKVPSGNAMNFSNNKTNLTNFITTANNGYGNYRSVGGTNGAAGLYRASLLFGAAPKTVAFNGNNVEYKRVVLFITDGVSNEFLNPSNSDLDGGWSYDATYASGSY
ncbi:MAG: VWA domain-containing protein, partial [Oscillochloris sp.]|nr:VWA domain-containing protein [Oscillochloris sp.]